MNESEYETAFIAAFKKKVSPTMWADVGWAWEMFKQYGGDPARYMPEQAVEFVFEIRKELLG